MSEFRERPSQGNGQVIHLTDPRAATGAFGLTAALAGVVESQARSISNWHLVLPTLALLSQIGCTPAGMPSPHT